MLRTLSTEEIRTHWEEIFEGIRICFKNPPQDEELWSSALLGKCLNLSMQIWVMLHEDKIIALMATTFVEDPVSFTKTLLVYSFYGYHAIPEAEWVKGIEGLKEYAKDKKCSHIVAYTEVPRIVEVAKMLKMDTAETIIKWRIK